MARKQKDELPELPEWMKNYDFCVGPYDQPVPPIYDLDDESDDDEDLEIHRQS